MFNGGKYGRITSEYWLFSDEVELGKEVGDDVVAQCLGSARSRKQWHGEQVQPRDAR